MSKSIYKNGKDINDKTKKKLTPDPGDLQRSLTREISIICVTAIAMLTLWSSINYYMGSYAGGIAWLQGSSEGLSQKQNQDFKEMIRCTTLLMNSALHSLHENEQLMLFHPSGEISVKGELNEELQQLGRDWHKSYVASSGETATTGFFGTQRQIWKGVLVEQSGQVAIAFDLLDKMWLMNGVNLTSTEGVLFAPNQSDIYASTIIDSSNQTNNLTVINKLTLEPDSIHVDHGRISLESSYQGYRYGDIGFHKGQSSFNAFFSTIPLKNPSGAVVGWLGIFVPEDVMLFWPKRGVLGVLLLGIILTIVVLWRLRKKTSLHLAPLTSLIRDVEKLNTMLGGTFEPTEARFNDMEQLNQVFNQLKDQLRVNGQLEDQLRQSQKMEVVGTLSGGVAHDFNNLLSVMLMSAEVLREAVLVDDASFDKEDAEELFGEIFSACEQAKLLTRQLLSLSQDLENSKLPFDVCKSTQSSFKLLRRLIPEGVQLLLTLGNSELWINGNENAFQQVLMNLVINGKDALDGRGIVHIRIGEHTQDSEQICLAGTILPGKYVKLEIEDNGHGINEKDMEKLFDPFFSLKGQLGTGLGLTVVYNTIVRSLGGAIDVKSGERTTFCVYMPLSEHSKKDLNIESTTKPIDSVEYSIVLIEDHPLVRKSLSQTLEGLGFEVTSFAGGPEFIQWLPNADVDKVSLVLSDVVMPGMSGPDVWAVVREQWPSLPFLFLTGYAGRNLTKHNVPDEMILMKPISGRALMREIVSRVRRPYDAVEVDE